MKKILFTLVSPLLLTACWGPNEEDFKSVVPSTPPSEAMSSQEVAELPLPEAVNYDVPFFSQAPDGNWNDPYEETCEEASIALAYHYLSGNTTLTKEQFNSELLEMVTWQNENFGDYEDTNVQQTALLLKNYYSYDDIKIVNNPTLKQLKRELAKGHLIIAPLAGRMLKNPFYTGEGPDYHMLVIKGYDSQNFITNDVGTKRGQNFIYSYDTIMQALHDWPDSGEVMDGEKRVLIMM